MTRLFDNLFPAQACVHANGDNVGRAPSLVRWQRAGKPGKYSWFTDSSFNNALESDGHKVAWLLEPREYRSSAYDFVLHNQELFDFILTFDKQMLSDCKHALPYLFGGTRIAPDSWKLDYRKTDLVSIVASEKRGLPGHKLRHEIIQWTKVHPYGPLYMPIERKLLALAPYQFHVAIEPVASNWFFSETLLDAMLTGCVPIYWGCPDVHEIFDTRGMIHCASFMELRDAVNSVTPGLYDDMRPYLEANFEHAKQYQLTEDWLYRAYPWLFDEEPD